MEMEFYEQSLLKDAKMKRFCALLLLDLYWKDLIKKEWQEKVGNSETDISFLRRQKYLRIIIQVNGLSLGIRRESSN